MKVLQQQKRQISNRCGKHRNCSKFSQRAPCQRTNLHYKSKNNMRWKNEGGGFTGNLHLRSGQSFQVVT